MNLRRIRSGAPALHERGFALIAMLTLAALLTAFLISVGLSRSRAELANEREDRNTNALKQAKAALIAYAAGEQWQRYKGQTDQPGGLPCPDIATNTGTSNGICNGVAQRVGRFPFATIGSDDLRDASGERLWYAVSSSFYKTSNNVINSDTQGLLTVTALTVTGAAPATNVVAIVFAPGPAIQDPSLPGQIQDRSGGNVFRLASYLEGYTIGPNDYTYASSSPPSETLNDRLLVITQADLMAAVEPAVAARIERDLKPAFTTYLSQWGGRFPFPTKFNNPDPGTNTNGGSTTRAQSTYLGTPLDSPGPPAVPMARGLVPISGTVTYPWSGGSVAKASGVGGIAPFSPTCAPVSLPGYQCHFRVDDGGSGSINNLTFLIQAQVGPNAGASLAVLPGPSDVVFTMNPCGAGCALSGSTLFGTLDVGGVGTVNFQATLPISCGGGCGTYDITVTIPDVTVSSKTSTADPTTGWYIANEWFRQTYYAVAPDLLPGGGGNCGANPPCLTVNKLPPQFAVSNDKQAILILAGRALNGTARPSATFPNYLENANLNAAQGLTPYIYESRSGVPTGINDRVVVLAP